MLSTDTCLIERKLASSISRREFLAATGAEALALARGDALASADAPAQKKPNVVVILADDLGYADLGCQGCKDIATPNCDSLAASGVRFTNGYACHPVCSPSRAGLVYLGVRRPSFGLSAESFTRPATCLFHHIGEQYES